MESFEQLGLSAPILEAITALGFDTPTDIQAQAIPHLLAGDRDFIGLAQTGTGKTAAFGLPVLEQLDPSAPHVQALILAPTRELGQQIAQQIELFSKRLDGIQAVAVYGGANIMTQIHALKRPSQIVIATPGRLIDLAKRKAIHLDKIEYVILDEADEMLNMGFKEELDAILAMTPDTKRTWLFSATMPREIRRLVKQYMNDPFEVRIDPTTAVNEHIEHRYAIVKHGDKTEALGRFMDLDADLFGVVFCRTKRDTQDLAESLMKKGYRADALHGDLSQPQRDRVMRRFKARELQVLIATDVAARGIDVNDVTHVFHHSLPNDQEYYTHRSGRTARAGKKGISLAFISQRERAVVNRFSKSLGIEFEHVMIPDAKDIASA
ncbi:MAG: DEAD/DEAH box helicase, partial [Flavobacteriales bacterium]